MNRPLEKCVGGRFALRSHEVEECIKKNEVMHITWKGETMTMDPASLKSKQIGRSKELTSKDGKHKFYLIDYYWEPNLVNND